MSTVYTHPCQPSPVGMGLKPQPLWWSRADSREGERERGREGERERERRLKLMEERLARHQETQEEMEKI